MLSFRVDTVERTRKILESVKLISYAESLGGVESLITYPMLQTHGDVPVEIRERLGITEDFLRMSVGIENAEDLIKDLEQALKNGAIRTYALTGTYPESLSQLLLDYHITYDKTKFVVEYVPNGSNLLPSISVIALSGSTKGGNAS